MCHISYVIYQTVLRCSLQQPRESSRYQMTPQYCGTAWSSRRVYGTAWSSRQVLYSNCVLFAPTAMWQIVTRCHHSLFLLTKICQYKPVNKTHKFITYVNKTPTNTDTQTAADQHKHTNSYRSTQTHRHTDYS